MGVENARNVLASVETIFQERKEVRDNASVIFKDMFNGEVKYQQYEVADIKMLQILLGTVYWQRQKGSCMFCKCNKRDGVINNQTHICKPITDKEHLKYYNKAQGMYQSMYENHTDEQGETNEKKVFKQLHEWAGNSNFGITGLGIHPDILPISMVRPDVMHLTMAVTKSLLKYMHNLMHYRSEKFAQEVEEIFFEFLDDEQILIWKLDKSIDTYDGAELRKFTKNFGFLSEQIQKRNLMCGGSSEWKALLQALPLWSSLSDFVLKAKIEDGEDYLQQVDNFETQVKQFYLYGKDSFLTNRYGTIGGAESTYMHILRFNIATFARQCYRDHKLGIGIFSVQGFKRRNKESKFFYEHHTNCKGNIPQQTLSGLDRNYKKRKLK
jgi:hypothetical protein